MSTLHITIRGRTYPITKQGTGLPCLILGLGTPTFRTLSSTFFQHFQVFGGDFYFVEEQGLEDISDITLETLIEDIKVIEEALGLDQYVLLGHSAYGILALEYVKKNPERVSAVIMVGTPLNSNLEVAAQNNNIFNQQADSQRKKIDAMRREQVAREDLKSLSSSERFLREYIYRDAPRYWHIPDYDCSHIWEGLVLDRLMERLFSTIFPAVDVRKNLESIQIPIFLAAGLSDYDCCPWLWQNLPNLPKKMEISLFEKSGHWPQYEEAENFDSRVVQWVSSQT
jgi:proline iminopeptidase